MHVNPEHLPALYRFARLASEAILLEELLTGAVGCIAECTSAPVVHARVRRKDAGETRDATAWHIASDRYQGIDTLREDLEFIEERAGPPRVLASASLEWVEDLEREPNLRPSYFREYGLRNLVVTPVPVAGRILGTIEMYGRNAPASRDDLAALLHEVATTAGGAVERLLREEALRISEAKFVGIAAIASDAIVMVDESQRITFFNQGAEQIFGYEPREVLGQRLEILIPEPSRTRHARAVRQFGEGPVVSRRMGERGRIAGLRKSGEVFPADASISRLEVAGKKIFTAVLRDVTERMRAEQELARSNAELEQFAYVASHDLQEPLRMVASYTQLLARRYGDQLDQEAHEFIAFAVNGVTRMQALINDLLALSRVGTRGRPFQEVKVDEVLDEVLMTLGAAIEEEGAVVTRDPLPGVSADPAQLSQLLQNLIANAIKFHKPDVPPRVHVSAKREGAEWRFSVADNGIGIAPEYAERVFVLFQRLHTRTEYPGTGIGLAICRKIVERHGGRIWFDSKPGDGSTFTFTLPAGG